jgi:serine/threonine protein phosphatase 1
VFSFFRDAMRRRQPAVLPDGIRVYVVGDVHGRADLLADILSRIENDLARRLTDRVVRIFVGDYIDRGPSSKDVIERLIQLGASSEIICLKGNHEACLLEFLHSPSTLRRWAHLGGVATLESYGVDVEGIDIESTSDEIAKAFRAVMPESHFEFFERLKSSFTLGGFFFVHAGVRPGVALAEQREIDLLWIRDEFLLSKVYFGKMVVHGHTPVAQPQFKSNRIAIDTAAFLTGKLTCLVIERDAISLL